MKQCVEVWTKSYNQAWVGGWHSGDIDFHLEWTLTRSVDVATTVEDPAVALQWGQRREIPVQPKEWLLTYQPFQGPLQQISGPFHSDWLTVEVGPALSL